MIKGPRGTRAYLGVIGPDRAVDAAFDLAFAWAITQATGSFVQAGVLFSVSYIPSLLLLPVGGMLGDRWGLLRTARWTLLGRLALMTVLALTMAGGQPSTIVLVAIGLTISLLDSFHFPAIDGLGGQLGVGSEDEQKQVRSAAKAAGQVGRVGGTFAVGSTLSLFTWAPAALCVTLLLMALASLKAVKADVPDDAKVERDDPVLPLSQQVRETREAARQVPYLPTLLGLLALSNACSTPAILLALPLKAKVHGWEPWQYALSYGAFLVASIIVSLWVNRSEEMARPVLLAIVALLPAAGGIALIAATSEAWVAWVGAAAAGAAFAASGPLIIARIMGATPKRQHGAMYGLIDLAIFGGIPAGNLAFGLMSERWSLTTAGLVMAAGLAVSALPGLLRPGVWSARSAAPVEA